MAMMTTGFFIRKTLFGSSSESANRRVVQITGISYAVEL